MSIIIINLYNNKCYRFHQFASIAKTNRKKDYQNVILE